MEILPLLFGPKHAPAPLPQVTRDDAAAQQNANDEVARRKGGISDILTGDTGVLPPGIGPKLLLGQ
jgi:hypothetical protein